MPEKDMENIENSADLEQTVPLGIEEQSDPGLQCLPTPTFPKT